MAISSSSVHGRWASPSPACEQRVHAGISSLGDSTLRCGLPRFSSACPPPDSASSAADTSAISFASSSTASPFLMQRADLPAARHAPCLVKPGAGHAAATCAPRQHPALSHAFSSPMLLDACGPCGSSASAPACSAACELNERGRGQSLALSLLAALGDHASYPLNTLLNSLSLDAAALSSAPSPRYSKLGGGDRDADIVTATVAMPVIPGSVLEFAERAVALRQQECSGGAFGSPNSVCLSRLSDC